jgi:hypothetical protein
MTRKRGPKYVAGINNLKYTINSNNNLNWVVVDYVICNLYTDVTVY